MKNIGKPDTPPLPEEIRSLLSTAALHLKTWVSIHERGTSDKRPYANTADVADRLDALAKSDGQSSEIATRDTERATLVAEVGDCCLGADPLCAAGCLVEKAIRKRTPQPNAAPQAELREPSSQDRRASAGPVALSSHKWESESGTDGKYVVCKHCGKPSGDPIHVQPLDKPLPVPMLLFCPRCSEQHIDLPNESQGWTNPPHATHTCQHCGLLWRPSNVETTGVANIPALENKHVARIIASHPAHYQHHSATREWISTNDSLPQFNTEVLIAFKDSSLPATAQLVRKAGNPGEVEWLYPHENRGDGYDWTVTHWMPLPDVPAVTDSEGQRGT